MVETSAICKNTFISFVIDRSGDNESSLASPKRLVRSRSAETSRTKPFEDDVQDQTQQSLQRLNVVLDVGISSPVQKPSRIGSESDMQGLIDEEEFDTVPEFPELQASPGVSIAELCLLQERLAKALADPEKPFGSQLPQSRWASQRRVFSNSSLSTMASEDPQEHAERVEPPGAKRIMQKARSWNCAGSMDHDLSQMTSKDLYVKGKGAAIPKIAEEKDVEFELRGLEDEPVRKVGSPQKHSAPGHEDMSHSQVPKNVNLVDMYNCSDTNEPPTTMMIRNIPGRYSQNDLMLELQDLGFASTYDFLYLPMDKGSAANVGYAFVNFVDASHAVKCKELFDNHRFLRYQRSSRKVASVSVAHIQGLEKNLRYYEKTAVNMAKEKRRRPVVMANIAKVVQ